MVGKRASSFYVPQVRAEQKSNTISNKVELAQTKTLTSTVGCASHVKIQVPFVVSSLS